MEATPELAFVLLRLAEDIIWPVTAMDGEAADLCADSIVLDEVGCVLLSALRDWARDSATTAVPGIARSIIRFVENVIPDPDDHGDTRATLEAMRDEHLARVRGALRTRCAPLTAPPHHRTTAPGRSAPVRWGAHPVRTGAVVPPSGVHHRPSGALHSVGGARTGAAGGAREWCPPGGGGAVEWARVETVEAVRFSLT
ncbi:hypothetical protein [Streptomyces fradiae]|uniref:hypothetical protein n=1 Tax=Streptomyces fradiae TaxID=1906 RepID=UPI0036B2F1C2